jgi:hypothetical protein
MSMDPEVLAEVLSDDVLSSSSPQPAMIPIASAPSSRTSAEKVRVLVILLISPVVRVLLAGAPRLSGEH